MKQNGNLFEVNGIEIVMAEGDRLEAVFVMRDGQIEERWKLIPHLKAEGPFPGQGPFTLAALDRSNERE